MTKGQFDVSKFRLKNRIKLSAQNSEGNLWSCKFPDVSLLNGEHRNDSSLVDPYSAVVCGKNFVCWIDCCSGSVLSKYTHLDSDEDLFCLDWGFVFEQDEQEQPGSGRTSRASSRMAKEASSVSTPILSRPVSIVAAGGTLGVIHLLNVSQKECYSYLEGHRDSVTEVRFLKKSRNRLMSASVDGTLRLWSLGFPTHGTETINNCLCIFDEAYFRINSFDLSSVDEKLLIVGCDLITENDEAAGKETF
jgi:hypothetical protein